MPLQQSLVNKAMANGLALDMMSFIQVVDTADEPATQQQILALYKENATIVFTSASAVYAVCEHPAFGKPDWSICCIGKATQKAVLEYFSGQSIVCSGIDAAELAANIIAAGNIGRVVFFCGDKRMDMLPDTLSEAGIIVKEIVVYTTVEQPQFVSKEYDGILFYSPSGVSSYFSLNIAEPGTVLFAIGNTTAAAIRQEASNKIVVSSMPSKEQLLESAIQYFQSHTTINNESEFTK